MCIQVPEAGVCMHCFEPMLCSIIKITRHRCSEAQLLSYGSPTPAAFFGKCSGSVETKAVYVLTDRICSCCAARFAQGYRTDPVNCEMKRWNDVLLKAYVNKSLRSLIPGHIKVSVDQSPSQLQSQLGRLKESVGDLFLRDALLGPLTALSPYATAHDRIEDWLSLKFFSVWITAMEILEDPTALCQPWVVGDTIVKFLKGTLMFPYLQKIVAANLQERLEAPADSSQGRFGSVEEYKPNDLIGGTHQSQEGRVPGTCPYPLSSESLPRNDTQKPSFAKPGPGNPGSYGIFDDVNYPLIIPGESEEQEGRRLTEFYEGIIERESDEQKRQELIEFYSSMKVFY